MASIFMPNGAFFSRNTPTPRALCLLLAELVKNNIASLVYIAVGVVFFALRLRTRSERIPSG